MQNEKIKLRILSVSFCLILIFCGFSLAYFTISRTDTFSSNATIANYTDVTWQPGNVTLYGQGNKRAFNISENNVYIVSLSESASIKGIANDGQYVYINDAGARIKVANFNGTVLSTHTISNLASDNNDLAHNGRFLFARNGGTVYMINLTSNISTAVTVDAAKPIPNSDGWLTGNIVDMPDKRIGFISQSSVNPIVLRLYNVSENGTYFSWSQDFNIASSWSTDNHGIVSDGDSLVLISFQEGHRIFSLVNLNLSYEDSWNMRPSGIGNPTFITYDHVGKRVLIGDYGDRDFAVFNGSYSQGSFVSTTTETNSAITNITNVSWVSYGDSLGSTIRVQVSPNNGTSWYTAQNGESIGTPFSEGNNSLLYRVIFTTSSGANLTFDSIQLQWTQVGEAALVATIISPTNITYYNSSLNFNVTLNKNGTVKGSLDQGISNFSFSGTNNINFNYTRNFSLDGNYTLYVYSTNFSGNETDTKSVNFTVYTLDSDGDGVLDFNDTLIGNESSVSSSGITNFNITVSGNSTNGTFLELRSVVFREGSQPFLNFSYNFSQGNLDLNRVVVQKESSYILLNFSGQLQGNKTVYISKNDFDHLCVKDEEISSISGISSSCDSINEIDFDSCIGSNVTIEGISCTDEGSQFRFDNLQHSAIRGSQDSSPEGGHTSAGGNRLGSSCLNEWICSSWSFCSKDSSQSRICDLKYQNGCFPSIQKPVEVRLCPDILFDVRATMLNSRVLPWQNPKALIDLKEVSSNDLLDIVLIYRVSNVEGVVYEESETVSIQNNVSFTKELNNLHILPGDYFFQVILDYGKNQTASSLQPFSVVGLSRIIYYSLILLVIALLGWFGYSQYRIRRKDERIIRSLKHKTWHRHPSKAHHKHR